MSTKVSHTIEKLGIFTPKILNVDELGPGEIGFITASVKTVADCKVGDTITEDRNPVSTMLPDLNLLYQLFFAVFSQWIMRNFQTCAKL